LSGYPLKGGPCARWPSTLASRSAASIVVWMATLSQSGRPGGLASQAPPLEGHNLFLENRPLVEALEREGAGWAADHAAAFGGLLSPEPLDWGRLANENPPRLRTHDRFGNRIDEVEFHPAWHDLMRTSVEHGLHALSWREGRPGGHVARAVPSS
jgi:putative acyl-CoA dehydrogenase